MAIKFTIFHVLAFGGALSGAYMAAVFGYVFSSHLGIRISPTIGPYLGIPGALIAGYIGLRVGRWIGQLPFRFVILLFQNSAKDKLGDELHQKLADPNYLAKNLVLLELKSRGEDVLEHIDIVYTLLESEMFSQRDFGWIALNSAYPNLAALIPDYPDLVRNGSPDTLRKRTNVLRDALAALEKAKTHPT